MDTTARMIDDDTIEITRTPKVEPTVNTYNVDFLLNQLEAIETAKLNAMADFEKQQAEVRLLLSHAFVLPDTATYPPATTEEPIITTTI
jgi:hypothetical protein